jgi:hypothetical protein
MLASVIAAATIAAFPAKSSILTQSFSGSPADRHKVAGQEFDRWMESRVVREPGE